MSLCLYQVQKAAGRECDASKRENWIDRDTLVWLVEKSFPESIAYDREMLAQCEARQQRIEAGEIEYQKGSTLSSIAYHKLQIEKRERKIVKYRGIIALIAMGGI